MEVLVLQYMERIIYEELLNMEIANLLWEEENWKSSILRKKYKHSQEVLYRYGRKTHPLLKSMVEK